MNWVFLTFVVVFVAFFAYKKLTVFTFSNMTGEWLAEAATIAFVVALFVFVFVVAFMSTEIYDFTKVTIYSAEGTESKFFLLVGSTDTESYIYYWTQREDGAFMKNRKLLIGGRMQTVIFEENRTDGELLVLSIPCANSFFSWRICFPKTEAQFHVPLGSVVQEFAIK